ncbi:MAG: NAD(+)/NADH kinase [bacterium]|nr:NAD(+)/NADH kinase [bacterium]
MTPKVGIYGNLRKPKVLTEVPNYLRWITNKNCELILDEGLKALGLTDEFVYEPISKIAATLDLVLSFGGDGTLLSCVREIGTASTPILGVNLGGLGYLAELSIPELYRWTDAILSGQFEIEERMLLQGIKSGGNAKPLLALNDFVFDRGERSRTIRLRTSIDNEYLNTYTSDGIIISTPTGSTGYSLSAGGPILEPTLDAIIVIPICPHTLAHRPMVIKGDRKLTIEPIPGNEAQVMTDGFYVDTIQYGDMMVVEKAPFSVKLITFTGRYFYQVLREKLRWGEDSRHPER